MKAKDIRCRLCKANMFECGGYLHRVNEKGVPGVWECRPSCTVDMSTADALMAAIDGEATPQDDPLAARTRRRSEAMQASWERRRAAIDGEA